MIVIGDAHQTGGDEGVRIPDADGVPVVWRVLDLARPDRSTCSGNIDDDHLLGKQVVLLDDSLEDAGYGVVSPACRGGYDDANRLVGEG